MNEINLTKKLIAIESTSGNEGAILSFIEDWLRKNDFVNVTKTDRFVCGKIAKNGRANACEALILAGHVDTVAPDPNWSGDPLRARENGTKIVGLGASDMKSGVAAQMLAAKNSTSADADVWFAAVASEEIDGSGSEAFTTWFRKNTNYNSSSAIIAEPTGLDHIEIGHRGNRFVQITFNGESAHAAIQTNYKKSALFLAQQFLYDIAEIVSNTDRFSDQLLGTPSIVPTSAIAGNNTSPNKTAPAAKIVLDIRTTPLFDNRFENWIGNVAKKYSFTWEYIGKPQLSARCETNAKILRIVKKVSGINRVSASHGATDQGIFEQAGISTVVFGPGEFSQCHVANEHAVSEKISRAKTVYEAIAKNM